MYYVFGTVLSYACLIICKPCVGIGLSLLMEFNCMEYGHCKFLYIVPIELLVFFFSCTYSDLKILQSSCKTHFVVVGANLPRLGT